MGRTCSTWNKDAHRSTWNNPGAGYRRRRRVLGGLFRPLSRTQTTAIRNITSDTAMKLMTCAESPVRAMLEATSASRRMESIAWVPDVKRSCGKTSGLKASHGSPGGKPGPGSAGPWGRRPGCSTWNGNRPGGQTPGPPPCVFHVEHAPGTFHVEHGPARSPRGGRKGEERDSTGSKVLAGGFDGRVPRGTTGFGVLAYV